MTTRADTTISHLILALAAVAALLPLVALVGIGLGEPGTPALSFVTNFDPGNYTRVWDQGRFADSMRASAFITVSVVALATAVSIPAGYALATMEFPGAKVLFYVILLGILMPFEATVIPLYYDLRTFGLTDTYLGVILPSAGLMAAFGTFWMRAFFRSVPRSLLDAARLDGASSLAILIRILIPFSRPAITTMVVLMFVWTWNDFLLPLVMLSGGEIRTAPLSLVFFQSQHALDLQGLAAAAVITAGPVVVVYVLMQRHFIRGMLSGAVKA